MADTEPVVLNEKGGEADKSLDSDEIVKKLRVSITNLKGSHMSDDGSKVDYSQISTCPKFEEYCNTAALLKFIKPESFNEDKVSFFPPNSDIYTETFLEEGLLHQHLQQSDRTRNGVPSSARQASGISR